MNDQLNLIVENQEKRIEFIGHLENTLHLANDAQVLGMVAGVMHERKNRPKYLANKRLAKDPIQLAKKEIVKEYETVKSQFKRRGFSAQFVRDMKAKYLIIVDIKTIERLVAKLNKENELIPPKPVKRVLS